MPVSQRIIYARRCGLYGGFVRCLRSVCGNPATRSQMPIRAVSSTSHPRIDLEAGASGAATIVAPSLLPSASAALSGLTSAPARPASRRAQATDASAQSAPPSALRQVGSYGGPALDALASGLSLAASRLSAAPDAAKLTGTLSGALWAGGAGLTQVGSASPPLLVTGANALGGVAGVLSAVQPWIGANSASTLAYSSAAAWAVNGAANMVRAGSDAGRHLPSRVLQGVSGAANVAAAAMAAAAASAAQQDEPVKAANLGAASSLAWGVGAIAALGSAYTAAPAGDAAAEDAPPSPHAPAVAP
nr:hypothetical protein [Xanthomonas translucens]